MRVVGIAVITALLSAGCAIQAGDPTPEEVQRPNELVSIPGGEQPSISARPESVNRESLGTNGPGDNPTPSPWTGGGDPHAAGAGQGGNGNGNGGPNQNPNPSPWSNPTPPRWGSVGGNGPSGG
jgi:hypothetical protein